METQKTVKQIIENDLSLRTRHSLLYTNIFDRISELKDFEDMPVRDILRFRNVGRRSVIELEQVLNLHGVYPKWLLCAKRAKDTLTSLIPGDLNQIQDTRSISPIAKIFMEEKITTWKEFSELPLKRIRSQRNLGIKAIKMLEVLLKKKGFSPKWKDEFWESL